MAGFIVSLGGASLKKEEDIEKLVSKVISAGVYSTNLNIPMKNEWGAVHEGTFADFLTMKEGDHIYFFCKRRIYGIGQLINVSGNCIHLNFPEADIPVTKDFKTLKSQMILNKSSFNLGNRFLCTFTGAPHFFKKGVDMDDMLASNPVAFKMLRVFSKLSFVKIDDQEDKAIFDMLLKENVQYLQDEAYVFPVKTVIHKRIEAIRDEHYEMTAKNFLKLAANKKMIKHEKALELALMEFLRANKESIFGKWDYISRQVVASPFKPTEYIDKMDIFGYKFVPGYETISKFLLIELKREVASKEVIHQAMKYVDWIKEEYSFGDYNEIEAFIVASNFPEEVFEERAKFAKRTFIKGRRPPVTEEWDKLKLIKYSYDAATGELLLEEA